MLNGCRQFWSERADVEHEIFMAKKGVASEKPVTIPEEMMIAAARSLYYMNAMDYIKMFNSLVRSI